MDVIQITSVIRLRFHRMIASAIATVFVVITLTSVNTITLSVDAEPSSTGCENAQGHVNNNEGGGFNPHCNFGGPPSPECEAADNIPQGVSSCRGRGNDQ